MSFSLLYTESILAEIDQWNKLDIEWGTPIDLETEDQEIFSPEIASCFSTLDKKPTFDSASLLKEMHKNICKKLTKTVDKDTTLNYEEFLQDLDVDDNGQMLKQKPFYFVNGQILSAPSVDEICNKIDNVFKSIEKLCVITSTVRMKGRKRLKIAEVIKNSFSTTSLSFDDTKTSNQQQDLDEYIDKLFNELDCTIQSLQKCSFVQSDEQSTPESVTTLVRKFSSFLDSPVVKCNKRHKLCSNRFKELTEFWKSRTVMQDKV